MSHQASHWALEQSCATATEKAILMVLASYVGADGSCYPGQDTIARQACCSVKSVERALQAFEGRGWLTRTARRRKDGSRTSDLLELMLASNPEAREQADTVSDRPEPTRHPVQTNPTTCPNQPDRVSGLTTFEPVRTEPVSEPVRALATQAGNDNDAFALVGEPSAAKRSKSARTSPTAAEQSLFEQFWSAYPKRQGKQPALTAYVTALRSGAVPAEMLAGAEAYATARAGEDPRHTKMAQGWLNDRRWADEIESPPPGGYLTDRNRGRNGWDPMDQAIGGIDWEGAA